MAVLRKTRISSFLSPSSILHDLLQLVHLQDSFLILEITRKGTVPEPGMDK
jgi:hypothetical protein